MNTLSSLLRRRAIIAARLDRLDLRLASARTVAYARRVLRCIDRLSASLAGVQSRIEGFRLLAAFPVASRPIAAFTARHAALAESRS